MKTIENYLNILHFCFYKLDYKLHLLSNKINPFRLLLKITIIKEKLEKKGITDFQKDYNKAFEDRKYGLSMVFAGGFLWGTIAIFFFSLLIIFNVSISKLYIVACGVLSGIISYIFVFKNDKYIEYFDRYEKWSKTEKRKYNWLTIASIVGVFFLFYLGLKT
ncbi:MAG: hypothetical protein ABS44_02900 [Chryseobacterium sp. SCN 40-13]|nr:MAG: hypothetical protein ABS44_02900 [Chryseobacterium sp. SCN 40-13]